MNETLLSRRGFTSRAGGFRGHPIGIIRRDPQRRGKAIENRQVVLPERWSATRKGEVVLRLLRGEDLGELSRETELLDFEQWQRGRQCPGRRSPAEPSA